MKNSKLLIAAAAFAVIGSAMSVQAASVQGAPVKNPSGGLIGTPQNFPTEGTYNFQGGSFQGGSPAKAAYGKPVRNPSGGLIGAPQNFPTPGTYTDLSVPSANAGGRPVYNYAGH